MIRGVLWNLSGMVAVALTMLVTTPLFLQHFGAERYGILATIWVVFGYFSVLDFGMGPAIVSFLSRPDRQDGESASGVFWTAVLMNLGIGVALGAALAGLFFLADALGWVPASAIGGEMRRALPWLLAMLPVSLIYPVLVGALDARRLFGLANTNQVAGTILAQALPLLAVMLVRPTLTVAIAGTVMGRVASALLLLGFCIRRLHLGRPRLERGLIRQLTGFGGWVALSAGIGSILDTADRLVITTLLGGSAAAWYAIAYNVVTRARVLPHAVARSLFPAIAADPEADAPALRHSARVLALALVPAMTAGMVLIDPLCRLWIGQQAAAAVVPVARLMLLGTYANCIAYIPVVALQARGQPARLARIHLLETPVFLSTMALATWQFGIIGAAASWSLRLVVDAAVLLWMSDMRRILWIDVVLQSAMLAGGMMIALFLPGGWPIQIAAVAVLLVGWMVLDTVLATRSGTALSLLTLGRWLRARLLRPQVQPAP